MTSRREISGLSPGITAAATTAAAKSTTAVTNQQRVFTRSLEFPTTRS